LVSTSSHDLLCLDEFSEQVNDNNSADNFATNHLNGLYQAKAVVVNLGVHLNSVTFINKKSAVTYKAIETGVPKQKWASEDTKRDLTKCSYRDGTRDISIWFLHANASRKNGKKAANYAARTVVDMRQAFIGDFNCSIDDVQRHAVRPGLRADLQFTQWSKDDHGARNVPGKHPGKKYNPHNIIDFAIADRNALNFFPTVFLSILPDDDLGFLILNFDHFPIAYDVFVM
jgi:hypothetical protein